MNRLTVAFWAMFCCAAALYLWRLGALAFTTDEIYHGMAAEAILSTGIPRFPDGTLYLKGALFSYAGALFSLLFGSIEFGVRFVSALSLLLTGLVVRMFCDALGGRRAGLLAGFVWFFHPWTMEFARWGRLYTLAALLLSSGLYCVCRYEQDGRRRQLFGGLALLGLATVVYPFCAVGFVGVAAYFGMRVYHRAPRWRRLVLILADCALGLTFCALVVLERHAGALLYLPGSGAVLTAFVGDTGRADAALESAVGFEGYYLRFAFGELLPFTMGALALGGTLAIERWAESRVRQVFLLLTCVGAGLLLVTFVHLQKGAPRYLFPALPLIIVATVVFYCSAIDSLLAELGKAPYLGLAALFLALFLKQGSFRSPFRDYGDSYPHKSFAPSPAQDVHPNYRSAAEYVKRRLRKRDVVIVSKHQFYYFYAGREADYDLDLGRKRRDNERAAYMTRTTTLPSCDDLDLVLRAHADSTRWLVLNAEKSAEQCVRRLSKKHSFTRRFRDARDPSALVYSVAPARRK